MMKRRILAVLVLLFITQLASKEFGLALDELPMDAGPYIDKVRYELVMNTDDQVDKLINGEVDIIGNQFDPTYLGQLYSADDIEVYQHQRLGYGITEINCKKYPMNITDFRRAVAFASNKHKIIEDGWLGLASLIDCHIPKQHPASIEEDMEYHYYDEQIEIAANLLENAGFVDTDDDGWREGPGLSGPGTVELDTIIVEGHPTTQVDIFVDVIVQAMLKLNISAEALQTSFQDYEPRLNTHGDYDMIVHTVDWENLDLDKYARDHSSDYLEVDGFNAPNWSNSTWDVHAETVLHSTDYGDILDAVEIMENVWVHSCPGIVMYQNTYFTAARTDKYDGITPTIFNGAPSFFTNLRVHKKEGNIYGGTYIWSQPSDLVTFNPFSINSASAGNILDMLYDPLVRIDLNGMDLKWMYDDFSVFTHDDDSEIPEGYTRIIVDIIEDAVWSDGSAITAEDFVFTLTFLRDNATEFGSDLANMTSCESPSTYRFICEFNTESYWHWHSIAYKNVLPSHIWSMYVDDYNTYQPSPSQLDQMVLSGPFLPTKWVQKNYIELSYNPDYFRGFGGLALSGPEDFYFWQGSSGNHINWTVTRGTPTSYELYQNGSVIDSITWDDPIYHFNIDNFDPGVYNFTLVIDDTEIAASDTVIVTVRTDETSPLIDSPSDISFGRGGSFYNMESG
jgi:ABC-type transport system substrate-binding protein